LISCIMPTGGRKPFVRLALDCFRQQDYPRRELIIIDDGSQDLFDLMDGDPAVRQIKLPARQPIGAKRNLACEAARGEIIVHWDDDDWHGSRRLSLQTEPILHGQADLTGLECRYIFDAARGEFWTVSAMLHARMFVGNVHGGTLAFKRAIFDQGLRFPAINLAEDAAFIRAALQKGFRLARVSNEGIYVYVRQGTNAWAFAPGRFLDSAGWSKVDCPPDFSGKVGLYRQCAEALRNGDVVAA
jgi:glycosyltransferase involved in cell wall biosynthesis